MASRGRRTAAASGGRPSPVSAVASSTTQSSGSVTGAAAKLTHTRRRSSPVAALVGEDAVGRVVEQRERAAVQGRRLAAQRQHGARQVQHGAGFGTLRLDAARARFGRPRQPRVGGPAVVGRRGPRDRRAAAVAPARIDDALGGNVRVLQTELLAGVEEGRAAQRQEHEHGGAGARLRAAQARAHARLVVVGEDPGRPARAHDLLDVRDARAPRAGLPRHPERLEVEGEVELVALAEVGRDQLGPGEVHLADHHALAGVLVEHGANAAQQRVRALVVVRADHVEVAADDVRLRDVGQRRGPCR